jgi:hypothetical protein
MARSRSEAAAAGWETRRANEAAREAEFDRRSAASHAGWEKRWDRGTGPVGEKGREYISKTYGPTVDGGYRPEGADDFEEYDDFDFYESEY